MTNPKYIMVYATVGIFLIIYLFGALAYGDKGFTTLRTFMNMFIDNAYYGISAVGMTMVLITGGIDLSVGAVASLTGMFIAYGTSVLGLHPLVCIAFSLVVGVGLGLLMGWVIHYLNVPPFITTLTGMFLARGVCSLISRESIEIKHPMMDALAGWKIYFMKLQDGEWVRIRPSAFINFNVIVFVVMIIIGTVILQKTRFGRNIYAIGGNEQSAKLMGLPVGRTKVLVYGFNGLCSVLAGVTYALYVKSGWNLSLQGAELDVITCAVIGGTLLTGGVGYMIGTLFGVLLKSIIPALITFNGNLLSWWGKIATGLLLLLFICIQKIVVNATGRKKEKKPAVKN
ncbi:MAG: sugar ABC transporter permease YjfF [Clostridia bacterium]|nr:sugar ABC transporter permease YjfF [Clostridia bacterium]